MSAGLHTEEQFRALQERNSELERANHTKDRFLDRMSHELRTALNGIIGFAEFLFDGKPGELNDKQKEYLDDILGSGRHLLQLINDMLDMVRMQSGKLEVSPETFVIKDCLEQVCARARPIARVKQIGVRVDVEPGFETVTLDPQRFEQILYNLLSNALKFTGHGGGVVVSAARQGSSSFRLSVRDNGIGIEPESMSLLFTPFEQLDGGITRRHGGTGLGLVLTRGIVDLLGGSIEIESVPGMGSVLSVVLPVTIPIGCELSATNGREEHR